MERDINMNGRIPFLLSEIQRQKLLEILGSKRRRAAAAAAAERRRIRAGGGGGSSPSPSPWPPPLPPMASTIPHHPAAPSPSASSPLQFSSASEANSFRLKAIVERLTFICRAGSRFDPSEFSSLCFALARGVDYALTISDVPAIAHRLPSLIKQSYERRNNSALQPAIMMLSISAKNACKYGWFHTADADALLRIANELFGSFCMTQSVPTGLANPLDVILKIIPRFYPQLKFCSLIVSFEAKPGYEVLMTDFQILRNQPPQEKIRLFVVQTDNLETSSCIISPPQVSFLINGKGVERRTNVSPDIGPQLPTDITKMLKYGMNIIQSIGYFSGTYLIALAYISKLTAFSSPPLKDYVEPVVIPADADSEIVEGASRITLNCPFSHFSKQETFRTSNFMKFGSSMEATLPSQIMYSANLFDLFKRIKTPVKGHLCKHHQCFDYDNFMEMNSRNPSWRCPSCHQHVSCIDLRIDRNMAKILGEVGKDVSNVVISADGSWNQVVEHNERKDQVDSGQGGQQDCNMECESDRHTNTLEDAVDLTTEDGKGKETKEGEDTISSRQVELSIGIINQSDNHACETEETKLFKHNRDFFGSQVLAESPLASYGSMTTNPPSSVISNGIWCRNFSNSVSNGPPASTRPNACAVRTSDSLLPVMTNPVITDDVPPVLIQEPLVALQASQSTFSYEQLSQVRQLVGNMQLQLPQVGSSMISREVSRPPIPRHVSRTPVAVQALPVQDQLPNSFKRMRINGPSGSSTTPLTVQPLTEIPGGLGAASGNMELQEYLRTPDLSMIQDRDHQNQQHIRSTTVQQPTALPRPNPLSMRQPLGADAYIALLRASAPEDFGRHLSNNLSSRYTNQSSSGTFRSNPRLPLGVSRELSGKYAAQQIVSPVGASATTQASRIVPSSVATPSPRLSSTEQPRNVTELRSEQNWRPTGRMRGSLTGNAYSAALNQYLTPTQLTPSPPTPSVVPSTSDQLPELNANTLSAHEPTTQPGHGDGGSQPGGSSI